MNVLVVAPHADDETLGCGGTLLRHRAEGDAVHWLLLTSYRAEDGFEADFIRCQEAQIEEVRRAYGMAELHRLHLPDARLDTVPMADLVAGIAAVVRAVEPEVVYLPYRADAHTDHRVAFDAAVACTKVFRFPSVRQVLVYETPSETDFALNPDRAGFRANVFVDISPYLDAKLDILRHYSTEMGQHPFPRSETSIRALATLRGAAAGREAAEAFMLLKEIR